MLFRSESRLKVWLTAVRHADWKQFADIRKMFSNAVDVYKQYVIFDVGGNTYRVITESNYQTHKVYIRFVLTHKEYSREGWKNQ